MLEVLNVIILACQLHATDGHYTFVQSAQRACQKQIIRCYTETKKDLPTCLKETP